MKDHATTAESERLCIYFDKITSLDVHKEFSLFEQMHEKIMLILSNKPSLNLSSLNAVRSLFPLLKTDVASLKIIAILSCKSYSEGDLKKFTGFAQFLLSDKSKVDRKKEDDFYAICENSFQMPVEFLQELFVESLYSFERSLETLKRISRREFDEARAVLNEKTVTVPLGHSDVVNLKKLSHIKSVKNLKFTAELDITSVASKALKALDELDELIHDFILYHKKLTSHPELKGISEEDFGEHLQKIKEFEDNIDSLEIIWPSTLTSVEAHYRKVQSYCHRQIKQVFYSLHEVFTCSLDNFEDLKNISSSSPENAYFSAVPSAPWFSLTVLQPKEEDDSWMSMPDTHSGSSKTKKTTKKGKQIVVPSQKQQHQPANSSQEKKTTQSLESFNSNASNKNPSKEESSPYSIQMLQKGVFGQALELKKTNSPKWMHFGQTEGHLRILQVLQESLKSSKKISCGEYVGALTHSAWAIEQLTCALIPSKGTDGIEVTHNLTHLAQQAKIPQDPLLSALSLANNCERYLLEYEHIFKTSSFSRHVEFPEPFKLLHQMILSPSSIDAEAIKKQVTTILADVTQWMSSYIPPTMSLLPVPSNSLDFMVIDTSDLKNLEEIEKCFPAMPKKSFSREDAKLLQVHFQFSLFKEASVIPAKNFS